MEWEQGIGLLRAKNTKMDGVYVKLKILWIFIDVLVGKTSQYAQKYIGDGSNS